MWPRMRHLPSRPEKADLLGREFVCYDVWAWTFLPDPFEMLVSNFAKRCSIGLLKNSGAPTAIIALTKNRDVEAA